MWTEPAGLTKLQAAVDWGLPCQVAHHGVPPPIRPWLLTHIRCFAVCISHLPRWAAVRGELQAAPQPLPLAVAPSLPLQRPPNTTAYTPAARTWANSVPINIMGRPPPLTHTHCTAHPLPLHRALLPPLCTHLSVFTAPKHHGMRKCVNVCSAVGIGAATKLAYSVAVLLGEVG